MFYMFGKLQLRTQQYSEAIEVFEQVVRDQAELLGVDHPRLVVTLTALSAAQVGLYTKTEDKTLLDEADKSLDRAEAIVGKMLSEDHLLAAEVHSNRGFVFCQRHSIEGREGTAAEAAIDEFDKALSIRDKFLLKDNRKYAKSLAGKARATYFVEKNKEAMRFAQEARQYFERSRDRMLEAELDGASSTTRGFSVDNDLDNLDKLISNINYSMRVHGYQRFNPPDN